MVDIRYVVLVFGKGPVVKDLLWFEAAEVRRCGRVVRSTGWVVCAHMVCMLQ